MLREVGHVGRYALHARARARDPLRLDVPAAPRPASRARRRGDRQLRGADLDPHLPQLAHFAQAAPVEQPERAIDFALAAARRADRQLAWEAAEHYRAALRAASWPAPSTTGCVPSCCSRSAHPRTTPAGGGGAGDVPGRDAPRAGSATRSCSAAGRSASPARGPSSAASTTSACRVLEEALTALGAEDSPLRARLLARLALELYYSGDPERRLALSEEAVELAAGSATRARWPRAWTPATTRCGGPRTSRSGSRSRPSCAAWPRRPATPSRARGAGWTMIDLLELGDVQGADIQIAAASKLAEACSGRSGCGGRRCSAAPAPSWSATSTRPSVADARSARDRPRPGRERRQRVRAGDVQHPPRAGPPRRGRARRATVHRHLPDAQAWRAAGAAARRARTARRGAHQFERSPRTSSRATRTG